MGKILWLPRICDVDNRRAVRLLLAGERVERHATVMTDVGNPACTLLVNDGLIRAPVLQFVVADQLHVVLFSLLLRRRTATQHNGKRTGNAGEHPAAFEES